MTIADIARATGHGERTVRKYARWPEGRPVRYKKRPKRPTKLDPYKANLQKRMAYGASDECLKLFRCHGPHFMRQWRGSIFSKRSSERMRCIVARARARRASGSRGRLRGLFRRGFRRRKRAASAARLNSASQPSQRYWCDRSAIVLTIPSLPSPARRTRPQVRSA